jgi:hypothetical protein
MNLTIEHFEAKVYRFYASKFYRVKVAAVFAVASQKSDIASLVIDCAPQRPPLSTRLPATRCNLLDVCRNTAILR